MMKAVGTAIARCTTVSRVFARQIEIAFSPLERPRAMLTRTELTVRKVAKSAVAGMAFVNSTASMPADASKNRIELPPRSE